jgi:hypothetical protein
VGGSGPFLSIDVFCIAIFKLFLMRHARLFRSRNMFAYFDRRHLEIIATPTGSVLELVFMLTASLCVATLSVPKFILTLCVPWTVSMLSVPISFLR